MNAKDLAGALVRHRIVQWDAIEQPEGYDNCETLARISELQLELFPDVPSFTPEIVKARQRFEKAALAYERADAWEDESGERIPQEIRYEFENALRNLHREETRLLT